MGDVEPLVFATAVEGLYLRGLKGRVTPALKDRLRALGLDLDKPLLPGYPLQVWADGLCTTAELLYPDLPRDQGIAELGRATIQGLRETTMGLALFPIFKLIGPQRLLRRMTRNLQSGSNFIETKLVRDEPRDAAIWLNLVREPGFYQGVLAAGLEAAGASKVEVQLEKRDGPARTYRVRWM